MLRLLLLTAIYPPQKYNMEDDLEAQLVQQLAEVRRLHAKKERREWEAKLKAEREAKEKGVGSKGEGRARGSGKGTLGKQVPGMVSGRAAAEARGGDPASS